MVYEADTLRDSFFSAWALSGHLSKTYNAVTNPYPLVFDTFHKPANLDEKKSVTTRKMTSLASEVNHELFKELRDTYEITVKYNAEGIDDATWDEAESNAEDMEEEVVRILKTIYDPNAGLGIWFETNYQWRIEDVMEEAKPPQFIRVLTFTLTRVLSFKTTVFHGYGGVLIFRISGSEGTGLPGGDYTYTEAYDVIASEGYNDSEELISGHPDGHGIAIHFASDFRGTLQFKSFAKETDVGAGTHLLNSLGKILSSAEVAEVYLMTESEDTEGAVTTLRETQKIRVINLERIHIKNQLVGFIISAKIIIPSVFALV